MQHQRVSHFKKLERKLALFLFGVCICVQTVLSKMASMADVPVLDIPVNMDLNTATSSGIPMDVLNMLVNVGANTLGTPKWSLRITMGKIYLDLAWDKDLRVPAKNGVQTKASEDSPTAPKPLKKKSPSTRRRDKLRFETWKAKKRRDLTSSPTPEPVAPVTPPGTAEPLDHTLPKVTNPAEVIKLVKSPQDTPISVTANTRSSGCDRTDQAIPAWESDFNEIVEGLPLCGPSKCKTVCWNCFKPEKDSVCLKKCTQCGQALYCSRDCQKDHWKANHGKFCKKILSWHNNHDQTLKSQMQGKGLSSMDAPAISH